MTPGVARADWTPPGGYVGTWANPDNWTKVRDVLTTGIRQSDAVVVEDELYVTPNETNHYKGVTQTAIEHGLNLARLSWVKGQARPVLLVVAGHVPLNFGYDLGTTAHKHWFRVLAKVSGQDWSSGIIGHLRLTTMRGNTWTTGDWTLDTYLVGYGWVVMGLENECASFNFSNSTCGMEAVPSNYNGTQAKAAVPFLQGYWRANELEPNVWRVIMPKNDVLNDPYQNDANTSNHQSILTWPEYDSNESELLRDTIARNLNLQEWLNCTVIDPGSCETDPLTGDPYPLVELPVDQPAENPGDSAGCPAPMDTTINFAPIWDTDLFAKFPFGIFNWTHDVLADWFAERHAPHFTLHVLGQSMEVDLTNRSPAMAIVRMVELICMSVLAVWWFATALLGLRGG